MKKILALVLAAMMLLGIAPVALADEAPTVSIFLQMPSEFNPETDPYVAQVEAATGVNIEWVMPPINSYEESLNLMMADGDYPDIIQFPSITGAAYINAIESEVLLPLDELVSQYENLTNYVDPASYAALRASSGGTLYGIARNTIVRQDGWLVRKDWCDKLGITLPEDGLLTQQEFYDLCYAFTYGDPDGNGVQDTWGLTDSSSNGNLKPFAEYAFGNRGWQAHEGTHAYMSEEYCQEHDSYKNALAYTAKLWQDGLIDPTWPTNSGNSYRDRFYVGAAGMARFFGGWISTYEDGLKANFPEAEVAYIVGIKDDEGKAIAGSTFGGNIYSFYGLTLSCEGKEDAALKVLDYLLSDEGWDLMNYGVKGIHWDEDANGNKFATEAYSEYSGIRSYVTLLRRYTDPDYFVGINLTPEQKAFAKDAISRAVAITVPGLDYGFSPASAQETSLLEYKSELDVVRSKIIVGELPVEAWDEALAKWYAMGGQQVVEDTIAHIEANQ